MITAFKNTICLWTVASLWLTGLAEVSAQDTAPPPGFSPSAPPEPGLSSGSLSEKKPGFLQRYGTTASSGSNSIQGAGLEDSVFDETPASPPPARLTPTVRPASNYSNGGYVPSEHPPQFVTSNVWVPRVWLKAEALCWWTKDSPLPVPLVTTGTTGIIGVPDTTVVIGNENINLPTRGGGRFTLGFALDQEAGWALESNYFFLGTATVSIGASADGSPVSSPLFVPYYNVATGHEDSTYIASPGDYAGTAVVTLQNFVQGAEANLLGNLATSEMWRWDGLAGFRYLNLHETMTFTTDSPNVPPHAPAYFQTFDRFDAQNNFYGGQFGVRGSYDNTFIFVNGTARLALGGTVEGVTTSGALYSTFGSAAGGYLTQPSNLGSTSQVQFAVIPSLDLNFGIHLGSHAALVVGYSFLYVSSVARPGSQIDHNINPSQSPLAFGNQPASNQASPALVLHDNDFWLQGLTFAIDLRF
ncbi:MAG: BBP7 family outer membrane beta-barrel protein [Planctomycetes bacterium]|nr:BBP7 family outer membrane beta-barrel protein [Planctomycetota bacterium]